MDIKEKIADYPEKILEIAKTKHEIIISFLMFSAYTILIVHYLGIIYGLLTSIVSSYIGYNYYNYLMNKPKKDSAKIGIINKKSILKFFVISFIVYMAYLNFNIYFINPEITITSHNSGEIIKFNKDNTVLKISGNSQGLANNELSNLFILYRRVDTNQISSEWNIVSNIYPVYKPYPVYNNPCTVYNDGSWECRFQIIELCAEWENGTLIAKSPVDSLNNISTNLDIVVLIAKKPLPTYIIEKLLTPILTSLHILDYGDYRDYPEIVEIVEEMWNDEYRDYMDDKFNKNHYIIPKHSADDHIIITPVIVETFNLTGSPYGLQMNANICYIPADNVTSSWISMQVIDENGNYLHSEGTIINLSSNSGNLSSTQVITDYYGNAETYITSGELGSCTIKANSLNLHEAIGTISFTLPSTLIEFDQWINSSKNEKTFELVTNFKTKHDGEYYVYLNGMGTEMHWPLKQEEWPIVQVEVDSIIFENIEISGGSSSKFPLGKIKLNKGNHTLKVKMINNLEIPLIGARNLYIEGIEFSAQYHYQHMTG